MTRIVKEFESGTFIRAEIPSGIKRALDDAKRDFHAAKGEKILQEELVRQVIALGIVHWRKINEI